MKRSINIDSCRAGGEEPRPRRLPKHTVNKVDEALGIAAYKTTGYKAIHPGYKTSSLYNLVIRPLALPHVTYLDRDRRVLNFSFFAFNVTHC